MSRSRSVEFKPRIALDTDRSMRDQTDDLADIPVDPDAGTGPPDPAHRVPSHWRLDVFAAVAAGGALGSVARFGISELMPAGPGQFPTATLIVNLTGSFVLGLVLVLLTERLPPSRYARAFLAVGVVGSFTTFSSFVVTAAQLASQHHISTAAMYFVASVLGGLPVAQLGIVCGRAVPHRQPTAPRHPTEPDL